MADGPETGRVDDEPRAPVLQEGDWVGMVSRTGDYLARRVDSVRDGVARVIPMGGCPKWGFGPPELEVPVDSHKLTHTHDMDGERRRWALSRSWPPRPSAIDWPGDFDQEPDPDDPYRRWEEVA